MEGKEDLIKHLAIPMPKGKIILQHAIVEDPNLGVRKSMEDFTIAEPDVLSDDRFSFYCILDGHGGSAVAEFVKKNYVNTLKTKLKLYKEGHKIQDFIESSIDAIEEKMNEIDGRDCGSTFCGVLIDKVDKKIYYINIGDSQVLAVRFDSKDNLHADFKCSMHKVSNPDEEARIKKANGSIINGRLAGNLLISRALGDIDLREYGLISTPEIKESELFKNKLAIIASDGVWDVISREDIVKMIKANGKHSLEDLAKAISKEAVDKGSMDNISVIVLKMSFK